MAASPSGVFLREAVAGLWAQLTLCAAPGQLRELGLQLSLLPPAQGGALALFAGEEEGTPSVRLT